MRNWKLILAITTCILILILSIIIFSVWSSVQHGNLQKFHGPATGPTNDKGVNNPGKVDAGRIRNNSFISHTALNVSDHGSVRDYTIPYKLPPRQEDEELWLDEIMRLNRLKPGAQTNVSSAQAGNHSQGSSSTRKHFDSGNFRVQIATVWDPHPSYQFHAFGRDWLIDLVPSSNFVVPTFQITEHHENGNESSRHGENNSEMQRCFYNGIVHGDEKSSVAVSLCHGMTGHIRTSFGSYFIEPVGDWKGPHVPLQHVIYKLPSLPKAAHDDDIDHPPIHSHSGTEKDTSANWIRSEGSNSGRSGRVKRSMSKERHVELMVAADGTMANYHGPNLRHYILTLLHIVALVFRDASIGNPINIALVNLHILKNRDFARKSSSGGSGTNGTHSGLSASDMLRNFCKWQKDINDFDDSSRLHHDTALLLTRETICRNPWLGKCDTLGLAELGTMCDHYASCALVQDNGLSAAFTIAHELGHVMNMPHDDDHKCQSFHQGISERSYTPGPGRTNASVGEHYVMSRMLDHNTYPWAWSKCSRHYLTEFLDAGHGYCLEDKPIAENLIMDNSITSTPSKQPGEIFNEHKQCQLVFGNESKLCSYMPVCRRLWCTHGGEADAEGCRTQHMPWADGTPCGESKWCLKGACVLKDLETLRIVDGGWGSWGEYGDCSRECGGGVRRSTRECDNPRPSNGGKYCTGPRVRYESCNTFECEGETKDFRAEQCAAFNNDNFKIQGLPSDVQWVPKYTGIVPKDRCKLFCRVMGTSAYYLLKEKVIDGTPCGPEKFDICVNGACLPAGCDRRLHSKKQLDICGVCGGDGHTCHTESGFYNKSSYGYSNVVRIPAGASSIDIRQISSTSRDDNYLALLDPSTNEYLLNGNFVVSMFHKTVHASGTILEYSGSDSNTERINSSRPIKSDLIVQVLSVGKLTGPSIYYQYVTNRANPGGNSPRNNYGPPYRVSGSTPANVSPPVTQGYGGNYNWRIHSFTCSSECYGNAIPKHECYRDDHLVNPHYCSHLNYPVMRGKYCNTHCKYSWKPAPKSECILQGECGKGYKIVTYKCAIEFTNATSVFLREGDRKCEDAGAAKGEEREQCYVPCDRPFWKYGAWGECDAVCGDGWQVRSAACNFQNQLVDPHYCSNATLLVGGNGDDAAVVASLSGKKYTIKRRCQAKANVCGQWVAADWSPCDKTCGEGYSTAAYGCYVDKLRVRILPNSYCSHLPMPATKRLCDLPPCYEWVVGNVNCEQCGVNVTRPMACVHSHGGRADDHKCHGIPKPDTNLYCGDCTLSQAGTAKYVSDHPPVTSYDSDQVEPTIYGEWIALDYGECVPMNGDHGRRRKVTCSTKKCNEKTMPAEYTECGLWSTGKWSECDATCGTGLEMRTVACTFEGRVTDPRNCPPPVPNETRECIKSIKCQWMTGPWSKCSKLCGHGQRLRRVECEGQQCLEPRPHDIEDCNTEPCPLWIVGEWSECSSSCGGGVRERSVKCMDYDNHPVHEARCRGLTRPNSTEPCAEWECGEVNSVDDSYTYRWDVSHWSNCSKKCGKGSRTRDVNCTKLTYSTGRLLSRQVVADTFCPSQKPKVKRGCARFPCSFKWIAGSWSDCSRDCGFGIQERTVSCHRVNKYGWIDPDPLHSCNHEDKPPSYQYCSMGECDKLFRWKTDVWMPCTAKCGKLVRQKRRVFCYNSRTNTRVNANHCKDIKKPNRKRKCPITPCGISSCSDQPNGYTIVNVAGRNVTVYCHNGKEYLSVNAEENYAEVYEKRLIRPETCPRDGARLETCECVVDSNRKHGFTYFDKIRINVTNLRVEVDDFVFTRQHTGEPINYGEAGDCYSSKNCPQGRFSINLNGTGFVVSTDTEWGSNGHRASMWIHKSKDRNAIIGRCGGYCGSCYPLGPTGIKLQVL